MLYVTRMRQIIVEFEKWRGFFCEEFYEFVDLLTVSSDNVSWEIDYFRAGKILIEPAFGVVAGLFEFVQGDGHEAENVFC